MGLPFPFAIDVEGFGALFAPEAAELLLWRALTRLGEAIPIFASGRCLSKVDSAALCQLRMVSNSAGTRWKDDTAVMAVNTSVWRPS